MALPLLGLEHVMPGDARYRRVETNTREGRRETRGDTEFRRAPGSSRTCSKPTLGSPFSKQGSPLLARCRLSWVFYHSPLERCRLIQGQVSLGPASVAATSCTRVHVAEESDPGLARGMSNAAGDSECSHSKSIMGSPGRKF